MPNRCPFILLLLSARARYSRERSGVNWPMEASDLYNENRPTCLDSSPFRASRDTATLNVSIDDRISETKKMIALLIDAGGDLFARLDSYWGRGGGRKEKQRAITPR